MEVEKIAANRYRLRAHDHVFTVDAQDVLDLMDYGLRWAHTLEYEVKLEQMAKQADPPSHDDIFKVESYRREYEAKQAQADQERDEYMEHHYLGGE